MENGSMFMFSREVVLAGRGGWERGADVDVGWGLEGV